MNTEHKVEEQGKQVAIVMQRSSRQAIAALAGLGAAFSGATRAMRPFRLALKQYSRYSPCVGCGNPAKGGHCFKCQQKEAAA